MANKSQRKSSLSGSTRVVFGIMALILIAGAATVLLVSYGQQSATAEPAIPSGAAITSWFQNGQSGQRVLQIFRGDAPGVGIRLTGTVKTDSNCDPDAQGLSHCHNIIQLDNGRSIETVNTHIMTQHPCLSPGDRISVTRLNENWVIASAAGPRRTY